MSKIDCTNIYNFMSEWERRREAEPDVDWTAINRLEFGVVKTFIEELQLWSDEHPKMTRKEKFEKILLKICEDNGFEKPDGSCGYPYCVKYNLCEVCRAYWDEEADE